MPAIRHELVIGASAEKVYTAIATQEGLAAWWTPDTQVEAELNSVARFGFGAGYFKEMKVIVLEPLQRVRWSCIKGATEWEGTTITFHLQSGDKAGLLAAHPEATDQLYQQEHDRATILTFVHDEWKDYTAMFAECNYTWAQFLRSLKLLCETGQGRPWPDQHR